MIAALVEFGLIEHVEAVEGDGLYQLTIERSRKVWSFPKERFVTYEASDEGWCRALGIGEEVDLVETIVIPQAYVKDLRWVCLPTESSQLNVTV